MVLESITTTASLRRTLKDPIGVGKRGLPIDAGISRSHLSVDADGERVRVNVGDTYHRSTRFEACLRAASRHGYVE